MADHSIKGKTVLIAGGGKNLGDYLLVCTKRMCYTMAYGNQQHPRRSPLPH